MQVVSLAILSLFFPVCLANEFKNRVNYGVVLEPWKDVQAVEDYWTHTIEIKVPHIEWPLVKWDPCKTTSPNPSVCKYVFEMEKELHHMQERARTRVKDIINQINSLFPQEPFFKIRNRSILDFATRSDITKELFRGRGCVKDLEILEQHIKALEESTSTLKENFQTHSGHSSFSKKDNFNFERMIQNIEDNRKGLEQYSDFFSLALSQQSKFTATLIDALDKFQTLVDQMQHLLDHLYPLKMERLSPGLVDPDMLRQAMTKVKKHLDSAYPSFTLVFTNPDYYYSYRDIFSMRHGSSIYVTIRFPIANKRSLLNVYDVCTFPIPVSENVPRSTQLVDVPAYFAISADGNFYAEITKDEMVKCRGKRLLHCPFPIPLKPVTQRSCTLALYQNSNDIYTLCEFNFNMLQSPKPLIRELSSTEVLALNVKEMTVQCPNDRYNRSGCSFCVVQLPCRCSLVSAPFYVPPRITDCRNDVPMRVGFPQNLPFLNAFSKHRITRDIKGDTVSTKPIEYDMPDLDIFQHSFGENLAGYNKIDLNLRKMASAVERNQPIYTSLVDPVIDGQLTIRKRWNTLTGLVEISVLCIVVAIFAFSIYLLQKYNELKVQLSKQR